MKACPLVAIKVFKTRAEHDKLKAEIDADPHRAEDLLVDRYGAGALETTPLQPNEVEKFVAETNGLVCLELNPDDAELVCNIQAIPISEIMDLNAVTYRACENGRAIADRYGVTTLPALIFFKDGAQIGKIEGFFFNDEPERALLIRKVRDISPEIKK
jgi:thiol-disulfide isomerase/thioredoxin